MLRQTPIIQQPTRSTIILQPPQTRNAANHQISAKYDNPRLS